MSALAFTLTVAGAFFLVACALLEGVLWLHDRWLDRRQRRSS